MPDPQVPCGVKQCPHARLLAVHGSTESQAQVALLQGES